MPSISEVPALRPTFKSRIFRLLNLFFCTVGVFFFALFCFYFYRAYSLKTAVQIKPNTILTLNLDTDFYETGPDDFVGSVTFGNPPTISEVVFALNRAAADKNVSELVVFATDTGLDVPQIQEIRKAVLNFRKSGKKTYFHASSFGELGGGLRLYYLASAFESIRLQSSGEVGVAGVSVESPYFRDALEKFGIRPSFSARHEYKSGANSLNASEMSAAERENTTALLNDMLGQIAFDIAHARKQDPSKMKDVLLNGPYFADKALEMGLIDKIEYPDRMETELSLPDRETMDLLDYGAVTEPDITMKTPVVAYVPAVGIIQYGPSLFAGSSNRSVLGFSTFSDNIRAAADDEAVKAIVLRIDSPGGGYGASDSMRREIEYIKNAKKKPVVCSMASTAASGGYFIALGCDKVLALPATVTGSVGVFGGKLIFKPLLDKLNVRVSTIQMGKNAGLFSATQDFTDSQRRFFNESLDRIYDDFTAKVSKRRGLTAKQTDAVARGRIFSGNQAVQNGLIDGIGGLTEAVQIASALAGEKENLPVVEFPVQVGRMEMLIEFLRKGSFQVKGILPTIKSAVERLSSGDFRLFYAGSIDL